MLGAKPWVEEHYIGMLINWQSAMWLVKRVMKEKHLSFDLIYILIYTDNILFEKIQSQDWSDL
jgi:hypothetical protein